MTLTFFRVKLGSKHSNDLQAGCRARQWAYKKFVGLGLTPSTYKFFVVPCLALQPLLVGRCVLSVIGAGKSLWCF